MPDTPNTSTTALPGDPFFILKECRELFVRRLTELARQSGVRAPEILEAVGREIGAAHARGTGPAHRRRGRRRVHRRDLRPVPADRHPRRPRRPHAALSAARAGHAQVVSFATIFRRAGELSRRTKCGLFG